MVGDIHKAAYPSSAPDTMCSSLMSWMLSMEPLEKGAVRGMTQPQPAHAAPPCVAATALLVAVEDKLGLLRDLPHAHSPVPAPSCHAALPAQSIQRCHSVLVPKAGGGTEGPGVSSDIAHTHPHTLSSHTLTASPRRSSLPHSTPSQSGRGTCCRAGGCLYGTPAPKGQGKGGLDYSRRGRGQAQGGLPQRQVTWHREPAPQGRSVGHFCAALPGARGTLSRPHLHWSRCSPLRLGPPSSSCPFTPFRSFTVPLTTAKHRDPEDRYALPHSSHSPGPSTKPGPLRCLLNVRPRRPSSSPTRHPGVP